MINTRVIDESLKKSIGAYVKAVDQASIRGIQLAGINIHADVIKAIRKPSLGPTVTRYVPTRTHKVSAPGEAPNWDRGGLAASYQVNFNRSIPESEVGSGLRYARDLELGTSKMDARPHLGPALKKYAQKNKLKDFEVRFGTDK